MYQGQSANCNGREDNGHDDVDKICVSAAVVDEFVQKLKDDEGDLEWQWKKNGSSRRNIGCRGL